MKDLELDPKINFTYEELRKAETPLEYRLKQYTINTVETEGRKLLDFMSKRIIFGEGLYTKGSLIDYTITYIQQLEEK